MCGSDQPEARAFSRHESTITPAMVQVGALELRKRVYSESLSEIVADIYLAMAPQREAPLPP